MTTVSASNIRRLALLSGLSDDEIRAVAHFFQQRQYAAGETIRDAGEPMDSALIPVHGRIELLTEGSLRPAASAEPGDVVGLDCLLSKGPQSMHCRAATDTVLLELKRQDFLQMANTPGTLGLRIVHQVLKHLARQLRSIDEVLDNWAIPPETVRPEPELSAHDARPFTPPQDDAPDDKPDPKPRKRGKRKASETDELLLERIRQYSEKVGLGDLDDVRVSRSGDQMIKPPGYDSVRRR